MSDSDSGSGSPEYFPTSPPYSPEDPLDTEPTIYDSEFEPHGHIYGDHKTLLTITIEGDLDADSLVYHLTHGKILTSRWEASHEKTGGIWKLTISMKYDTKNPEPNIGIYKAAVEMEHFLLVNVVPIAQKEFSIRVDLPRLVDFENFFSSMKTISINQEWTNLWLNMSLARRIYKWFKEVVPTFSRAFITDDMLETLETFSTKTNTTMSATEALSSRQDNVLLLFPSNNNDSFVIDGRDLTSQDLTSSSIRYACKKTGTLRPENILSTMPLIDLQKMGTVYNTIVRHHLLRSINLEFGSRVFCIFPSFDEFPGMKSDESQINAVSALHCNPSPPGAPQTIFKTFGITQCSGEEGVYAPGNACFSEGTVFRMNKPDGGCGPSGLLSLQSTSRHPTCCQVETNIPNISTIMTIYGERTNHSDNYLPGLEKSYDWYVSEFPGNRIIDLDADEPQSDSVKIFRYFEPNCDNLILRIGSNLGLDVAKSIMTRATSRGLVNRVKIFFEETETMALENTDFSEFISLFRIFPLNKTVAVVERQLTNSNVISMIDMFNNVQNKVLVIQYPVNTSNSGVILSMFLLRNGFALLQTRTQSQSVMRRGHIDLKIHNLDTNSGYVNMITIHAVTIFERKPMSGGPENSGDRRTKRRRSA